MAVQSRRGVIAVFVLLVLFASQAAYAMQAQSRSNGHCVGEAPPSEPESCPLPLWLTCCDDHAAVGAALDGRGTGSLLALRLASASAFAFTTTKPPTATHADLPPDTPRSRSVTLLI